MDIDKIHAMLLALMREEERTVGVEEVLFFLSQTEDDWQPLVDEIPFHGKGPQAELLSFGMLFQVLLLQSAELSWSRQLPLPGESASQHRQKLQSLWEKFSHDACRFVRRYGEKRLHDLLCSKGKPGIARALQNDF